MLPHDARPSETRSTSPYLGSLSQLAAQSFSSTTALIDAILTLIASQIGLRTSFLTQITVTDNRNHVIAAYNDPDGCGIAADTDFPLEDTF